MRFIAVVPAILLASAGVPALAQDDAGARSPEPAPAGTPQQAADVQEALAAYLTQAPFENGTVRVEPDAAGQRITLDPAAFLSELTGNVVQFSPVAFVVSARSDGNWNVFTGDPLDLSATIDVEGQLQTVEYRQDSQAFKGIFSPVLATFLSAEGRAGRTTSLSRDALSSTTSTIGGTMLESNAAPGPDGSADIEFRQVYEGYAQTAAVTLPEGEPGVPPGFSFDFSAAAIETSGSAQAAQTRPLLDLYAFLLAQAQDLAADPQGTLAGPVGDDLKNKVRTVLPLWEALNATASASEVSVSTLFGDFRSERMTQTTRMTGISSDASLEVDMTLAGAAVESAMMPDWAVSLVPDLVEIGFTIENVNLAAPLEIALNEADLAADQPFSPQVQESIAAAFDAERITSRIKPSRIRADDLDIAFSGDLSFANRTPATNLDVSVTGLDQTIETLQAAAEAQPELLQVVGSLQLAKGFAKPLADGRLQWRVNVAQDGSVTVNGAVLKGPDTAPDVGGPQGAPAPGLDSDL